MTDTSRIEFNASALVDGIADANARMIDLGRRIDLLTFALSFTVATMLALFVVRGRRP